MIADDIMAALVAASLAQNTDGTKDWMLRVDYMPKDPDRSIGIYYAGGRPPETAAGVGYPTMQIRVRGQMDDHLAVLEKDDAIFQLLHNCNAPVILGAGYTYCFCLQSAPLPLGVDELRRPSVARNYRIMALNSK